VLIGAELDAAVLQAELDGELAATAAA